MDEFICKISDDSTFMLASAVAVVLALFVVLMVVISSMRIKTYKDRFINLEIDNQEKESLISNLQKEMQEIKIKNAQQEQELSLFAETKKKLATLEEKFESLQNTYHTLEKLQGETRAELDYNIEALAKLKEDHTALLEKYEAVQEDNNKLHVNNARLLMKLESEARFLTELQKRDNHKEGK